MYCTLCPQKSDTDVGRYNFDVHELILTIFGRNVEKRVSVNASCRQTRWGCHFYRAMLCIRGTSHGLVSICPSVCLPVCLSVTSRCSTKTAKRRITQIKPHDSQGSLVFWYQRSPRNSTGVTTYEGAECRSVGQNRRLLTNNRLYIENGKR